MKTKEQLKSEILAVEEKKIKCEPNSIMGVHWSSKLAGLKRELRELES